MNVDRTATDDTAIRESSARNPESPPSGVREVAGFGPFVILWSLPVVTCTLLAAIATAGTLTTFSWSSPLQSVAKLQDQPSSLISWIALCLVLGVFVGNLGRFRSTRYVFTREYVDCHGLYPDAGEMMVARMWWSRVASYSLVRLPFGGLRVVLRGSSDSPLARRKDVFAPSRTPTPAKLAAVLSGYLSRVPEDRSDPALVLLERFCVLSEHVAPPQGSVLARVPRRWLWPRAMVRHLTRADAVGGVGAERRVLLAQGLHLLGRHSAALRVSDTALDERPEDPDALLCRALALHELKRAEEARVAIDAAVQAGAPRPGILRAFRDGLADA